MATEPLFPRYLFIRLSDDTRNWFPIRSTRGVFQLLIFGTSVDPIEMPETMIDCLKQRCAKEESFHELFKSGEMIEITQDPFKGLIGFLKNFKPCLMAYLGPCCWLRYSAECKSCRFNCRNSENLAFDPFIFE